MFVTINPDALVSTRARAALLASTGALVKFTEAEASRIAEVAAAGKTQVQAIDFRLMNMGILVGANVSEALLSLRSGGLERAIKARAVLTLMPTERCNFRCTYCYESFERGRMSPTLVESVKAYCWRAVGDTPILHLAWFGGEPLLHPDIVADVTATFRAAQASHKTQGSVSITTNAYDLSTKTVGLLQDLNIDAYQITIDGPQPLHDGRRHLAGGGKTYDRILQNILHLLRVSRSRVVLRINMQADDASASGMLRDWLGNEIFPLFDQYGPERVTYSLIPTWRADTRTIENICLSELRQFHVWWGLQKILLKHQGQAPIEYLAKLVAEEGALACYAGTPNSYVIGSDGRVYKCTVAFDLPANHVGMLESGGVLSIDKGKEDMWIVTNAVSDAACRQCGFAVACQGLACPLVRIQDGVRPCPTQKKFYESILEDCDQSNG